MGRPLVTSAAERDFADALKWYAGRSVVAADRFETEFQQALDMIGEAPLRFPLCDEHHRFFLLDRFPYQVIYRPFGEEWAIIALAHTKQRPGFWSDR